LIAGSESLTTSIKEGLEIILLLDILLSRQHAGIYEIGGTNIFLKYDFKTEQSNAGNSKLY